MRDKYGDERRPRSSTTAADSTYEDLIAEETNAVTISHDGFIKRHAADHLPHAAPRRQGRLRRRYAKTTSSSTSSSPPRTPICSASPTAASCTG